MRFSNLGQLVDDGADTAVELRSGESEDARIENQMQYMNVLILVVVLRAVIGETEEQGMRMIPCERRDEAETSWSCWPVF